MGPTSGRGNHPLVRFGGPAREHLGNRLHKGATLIHPVQEYDWLIEALGCTYPGVQRRFPDRAGPRAIQCPWHTPGESRGW
jgi:hypothetical protein